MEDYDNECKIAVIGMAGRFPGADNIAEFFSNLERGINSIRKWTKEELLSSGVAESLITNANYKPFCGYLENAEYFDNELFGISGRDALLLNPQHRVFLESCWSALENAGYNPTDVPGIVGVYAGSSESDYLYYNLLADKKISTECTDFELEINNSKDQLAARVSYYLNLRGPSMVVQTACSTSLVAIHVACQSIIAGECTMALAGGVSIPYIEKKGYLYREGMNLSRDGNLRAFDENASGMVTGFGCGVVVLKTLKDAIKDNDKIDAVILSSAVTNDGKNKSGYTAPSVQGQIDSIQMALRISSINVENIHFVEAHGSGTLLGDPIEISALKNSFADYTSKRGYCAISSVKSNIGHLDAAAGIVGFIKAVLQLREGIIFPACNFNYPNKAINFLDSPFYVPQSLISFNEIGIRTGGVNSLGIGGTNCFILLQNYFFYYKICNKHIEKSFSIIFSSRSEIGLISQLKRFLAYLECAKKIHIEDVVETISRRNIKFKYIVQLQVISLQDLIIQLRKQITENARDTLQCNREGKSLIAKRFGRIIDLPGYEFSRNYFYVSPGNMKNLQKNNEKSFYDTPTLVQFLKNIWREVLEIKTFNTQCSFFELGGHSISSLILVDKLSAFFNKKIPPSWVDKYPTLKEQAISLAQLTIQKFVPFVRFKNLTKEKKVKLLFFHASISGAEVYKELSHCLDERIDFVCIDSLNLNADIPMIESLDILVEIYVKYILQENFGDKLYLGGWSLGGIIALEVAKKLACNGIKIPMIFMLDTICYSPESKFFFEKDNFKYFRQDVYVDDNYKKLSKSYKDKLSILNYIETKMVMDYTLSPHKEKIINFIAENFVERRISMDEKVLSEFKKLKLSNGWPKDLFNFEIKRIDGNHQNIISGDRVFLISKKISDMII